MLKLLTSFLLIVCFIAPTMAQAYDAEAFQKVQQEHFIKAKLGQIFEKMSPAKKEELKSHLIEALVVSEQMLGDVNDTDKEISAQEHAVAVSNLESLSESMDAKQKKGYAAFLKGLKQQFKHKTTQSLAFKKSETLKKIVVLKDLLDNRPLALKVVMDVLLILAGIAYIYALLFFVAGPVILFAAGIFGAVLDVFGVYLGIILGMAVILALVVVPAILIGRVHNLEPSHSIA